MLDLQPAGRDCASLVVSRWQRKTGTSILTPIVYVRPSPFQATVAVSLRITIKLTWWLTTNDERPTTRSCLAAMKKYRRSA
jgi:hypothetical protein